MFTITLFDNTEFCQAVVEHSGGDLVSVCRDEGESDEAYDVYLVAVAKKDDGGSVSYGFAWVGEYEEEQWSEADEGGREEVLDDVCFKWFSIDDLREAQKFSFFMSDTFDSVYKKVVKFEETAGVSA